MSDTNEWITGNVTLSINGAPLQMQMTVPAAPVKPQRMLPIFQQMTNSFVEMGVSAAESNGETVSCRAGCGACCRQMVPLPEFEAYRIAELVEEMPEERGREIRQRFEDAVSALSGTDLFERLSKAGSLSPSDREELVLAYFRMGVPCPFLENESCSIHADRPIACREYLVSSPAENCANPSAQAIKMIEMPVKPSEPLRRLGQTRSIAGVDFIPLVLALKWSERNPEKFPEKTGEQWMADFFAALTKKAVPTGEAK
ncbi:MAG: YkgJ family cysteine cluster protein [Acidobacteria bacterium]|nr:YkgJ family cysteine cluster protein [Acidobacteriota bacterium]